MPSRDWQVELDSRHAAARRLVEERGCGALLAFGSHGHGEHFRYLTNFAPVLGDMWLVMNDQIACVLDFAWQLEEARRRSGIDDWDGQLGSAAIVGERLAEKGAKRIAVAGLERMPVTAFETIRGRLGASELLDVSAEFAGLRRAKSPFEVSLLREAARLTDGAFAVARAEARPGVTERELAARVGQALGAEWAFTPTVISGNDDPIPIREPTGRRLVEGDSVMVDIGAAYEGYQADAARTIVLGKASSEQQRVWAAVQRAYEAAVELARPGVSCRALHQAAARAAEESGYELAHRIGHGIGLATSFEWPDLANEQEPLQPGVTICIEPGIAVAGAGMMKLEDDLVITVDGCELLTHSERSLETTA